MVDYGKILKSGEKAIYDLRELYDKYGYREFKAGKFEDYELYSENKDFLTRSGAGLVGSDGKIAVNWDSIKGWFFNSRRTEEETLKALIRT